MKYRASPRKSCRSFMCPEFERKLLAQMIGATCLLAATLPSFAADAGQLLQQLEKERQTPLPQKSAPAVAPEAVPVKSGEGDTVTVTAFTFSGNTLLTQAKLAKAVVGYLNRPVTLAELRQAAGKVAELYRNEGWVVRAILPPQDIQNGNVTIQVVEAVLGNAIIEGAPSKRFKAERAQSAVTAAQSKEKPLNTNALDRALLILDDFPGIVASGSLKNGASAGETDVVVKLADEPWLNGDTQIDNTGSRSTGSNRLSGNFYLNSPSHIGDQVIANAMLTDGSDFLRLAYSAPVAYDGWRVGASASAMNYKLITSEFDGKNGKGNSRTLGGDASYPFIRSRNQNLYLGLNFDQKAFDNQFNGSTTSHYDITSVGLGLNGNLFDELLGGGVNTASLAVTQGNVALGTLDSNESANTGGDFRKIRYSASRQQFITDKTTLYAAFSGQQSGDLLDSSEKFYLGGVNGVRAYPVSEGGGASGNLINLEWRTRLPRGFLLTGFYDYGDMRNNDSSKSYSLKGAGLSLSWQAEFGLLVRATWARRIGDNPNSTSAGNDQDGSFLNDRFWLIASIPFSASGSGKSAAERAATSGKAPIVPDTAANKKTIPAMDAVAAVAPPTIRDTTREPALSSQAELSAASTATEAPPTNASVQLSRDKPLMIYGIKRKTDPLSAETKLMLDDVAKAVLLSAGQHIEVSGHTDQTKVSKNSYNMQLALERAVIVQQYLIAQGVPASQIKIVSYGFTKPVASNETQAGRDQNRRVEIKLID